MRLSIGSELRRVVITGIGAIHAEPLQQALAGQLSSPPLPPPEITAFEIAENVPAWGFEVLDLPLEAELPSIKSFVDRTSALALLAARRALLAAGVLDQAARPASMEIGCAYGTTLGCLEAMGIFWNKVKTSNPKFAQPLPFTHGYANSPSSLMCIEFGLRGPSATFSGGRLAGMEALMFAFDQIRSGSGEIILAGASESLTPGAFNHLRATGALSESGSGLDGGVPGEGAAMFVLESEASAIQRGATILCELKSVLFPGMNPGVTPTGEAQNLSQWTRGFSGEALSVSPLLALACGAGMLAGTYRLAEFSGPKLCAEIHDKRTGYAAAILKKQ